MRGKAEPKPQPVAAIQAPQPKAPEDVEIRITSDPPNARVMRADTGAWEDGRTPLSIKVKRGKPATFDIQVKLEGYKPQTRTVSTERSSAIVVALEKEPEPVAAVTPDKPDREEKRKHRSSSERRSSAAAEKTDKAEKLKPKEETGDDMKLLQPKF